MHSWNIFQRHRFFQNFIVSSGEKKKKHSYLAHFCGSNFARSSIRSLVKSYFTNACYIQHPIQVYKFAPNKMYDVYRERSMTALRSIVRNIVREPRPCSKFSIARPSFTIHTWNVYTLLTACLNLLYCIIYIYIHIYASIYAYVCYRGSCIARICIMQPDAATLGAYVTRYISLVSKQGRKRDENVSSFPPFAEFFSNFKDGNGIVSQPLFPCSSILFERVVYTWPRGYDRHQ